MAKVASDLLRNANACAKERKTMSGRPILEIIGDLERLLGEDDVSHEALKTRVHRIWSALVGDPTDSSLSLPPARCHMAEG